MTTAPEAPDIFLSYASPRRPAVNHFASILRGCGYNVWYDYELIEGRAFRFQLDAILRSSRSVMVLWCPLSVQSRWVHEEAGLAQENDQLLPVLMEDCDLVLGTRELQYTDLTGWDVSALDDKLAPLLRAIQRKIAKPPIIDKLKLIQAEKAWTSAGKPKFSKFPILQKSAEAKKIRSSVMSPERVDANPAVLQPHPSRFSLVTHGQLTIGCFPYPPFVLGTDPDQMSGPWIELGKAVASRLGLQPKFRLTSFGDLLKNTYSSIDVMLGVFQTDRRETYFDFTRPINRVGLSGVCCAQLPMIDDATLRAGGYRVAVQDGKVGWEYAQDEMPRALDLKKVVTIDTVDGREVLDLVQNGKFDIALMDQLTCVNFLRDPERNKDARLAFDGPLDMFDCCFALRRTSGLSKTDLDRLIYEIRNETWYRDMERRALIGYEAIIRLASLR